MTDEVRAVATALQCRGVRRGFPAQRLEMAQAAVRRGWTRRAVEAAACELAAARCGEARLAARLAGMITKADPREFRAPTRKAAVSNRCVHGFPPWQSCAACAVGSRGRTA